jgi:N-acylneuraminate cytidylyltransferase
MASIAVIPARGGSKRIPRKNVKLLNGKPAIAYSIELARSIGCFSRVIVSTDDPQIAEVSLEYGAEVPFVRSSNLSDDFTITVDVVADAIEQIHGLGDTFNYVCCIYPVTPLLMANRVEQALELLESGNWDYVFPAIEFPSPIERGFKKLSSGLIEFGFPEFANTRTQDIDKTFHDAGQFYFGKADAWLDRKPILSGNSTFIELEKNETLDIDDLEDWALVEQLMKIKNFEELRD